MNPREWLTEWFVKNTTATRANLAEGSAASYFERGWVDSFAFITFLADVEDAFQIRFTNDEFQDRSFATLDGLTSIIETKLKSGGSK